MKHRFHLRCLLFAVALVPVALRADPAGETKTLHDLSYVTNGHARQKLDLYLPPGAKRPLLVYIHGGAWRAGSRGMGKNLLFFGYAVADLEYRFTQDAIFPAQIEDCKSAIRWLRAHAAEYGYDPTHIAAIGDSAGGHLTALLATTGNTKEFDQGENLDQSSAIQCAIDLYGPTDFPQWKPPTPDPLVQLSGSDSALVQLFGGTMTGERLELARKASPVTWVSRESAPIFILHGTKDPLVSPEQSQELVDKYNNAGATAKLELIEGAGHGGGEFFAKDRLQREADFLKQNLEAGAQN